MRLDGGQADAVSITLMGLGEVQRWKACFWRCHRRRRRYGTQGLALDLGTGSGRTG